MLGLIDINKGKIVLDDQDMTNSKLYKKIKIGYVPQSIFLVDDSIKQNIILNNQTNIDERLIEVIKISCLTDFINSLPKKILTHTGEHASKISGGQKQRIGIARALFTKPDILILDEATNALDGVTEDTILNNIINKSKDLTVIIISHRDSSLDKCDKIFEITSKDLKRLK